MQQQVEIILAKHKKIASSHIYKEGTETKTCSFYIYLSLIKGCGW
jgi:hypothetical protein